MYRKQRHLMLRPFSVTVVSKNYLGHTNCHFSNECGLRCKCNLLYNFTIHTQQKIKNNKIRTCNLDKKEDSVITDKNISTVKGGGSRIFLEKIFKNKKK